MGVIFSGNAPGPCSGGRRYQEAQASDRNRSSHRFRLFRSGDLHSPSMGDKLLPPPRLKCIRKLRTNQAFYINVPRSRFASTITIYIASDLIAAREISLFKFITSGNERYLIDQVPGKSYQSAKQLRINLAVKAAPPNIRALSISHLDSTNTEFCVNQLYRSSAGKRLFYLWHPRYT